MGAHDGVLLGDPQGRRMLSRPHHRGFTLVELLVGLAIVAMLLAMAAPSLRTYSENSKLRASAETFSSMLQKARMEAVTRNAVVEFMFTNQDVATDVDAFVAAANGRNWVMRVKNPAPASTPEHILLGARSAAEGATNASATSVQLDAKSSSGVDITSVNFNSLGQPSLNALPDASGALREAGVFAFSNPLGGACDSADGGAMRCLQVRSSVSGEVRICDPTVTATGDSRKC